MSCKALLSLSTLLVTVHSAAARPYLVTDLGDLGFGESRAYRINAAGEVAGWSSTVVESHAVRHAFLYSGGTMHDLATDSLGLGFSEAWGINDAGEVVGKAENAAGKTRAFMYSGGAMVEVDPGFGGATSVAYAINDAGQIVGVAARKYTLLSYDHAFRWTDGNDNGAVDPLEVLELLALDGNTTSRSYAQRC